MSQPVPLTHSSSKSLSLYRPERPALEELWSLDFHLPPVNSASEPPEARGLTRDQVRLMVSYTESGRIVHATFREIPRFLEPGDVLVINTSGTMKAALDATREDATALVLHLSTHLPASMWIVEVRRPAGIATRPFPHGRAGEKLRLPGGGMATLHTPYLTGQRAHARAPVRLWIATLDLPCPVQQYLDSFGRPIRYNYVREEWPISYYQTVYATEIGSAEMPSAGRAFTSDLITALVARGIQIAPLLLHTGVASLEDHEPPYEEYYNVPRETAAVVNVARAAGKRIVAVGTTVVRALETVTGTTGTTHPGEGWTRTIITPERGLRVVNAMLTGLHEPRATHVAMIEALAGRSHLELAYAEALANNYLWHEFGDLHLIL
jgi:S-adenosylmethionine:tRNA ribosyltransferase-isomerase